MNAQYLEDPNLSTLVDNVDQVRAQARDLHRKIAAQVTSQAINADLRDAATQAQTLAASLQAAAKNQRSDTKQHLEDAATSLKEVATEIQSGAQARGADLRAKNLAALTRARSALQDISSAIAANRSATAKQPA